MASDCKIILRTAFNQNDSSGLHLKTIGHKFRNKRAKSNDHLRLTCTVLLQHQIFIPFRVLINSSLVFKNQFENNQYTSGVELFEILTFQIAETELSEENLTLSFTQIKQVLQLSFI